MARIPQTGSYDANKDLIAPQDHPTEADDDIMNPDTAGAAMLT